MGPQGSVVQVTFMQPDYYFGRGRFLQRRKGWQRLGCRKSSETWSTLMH